jgi:RHH-type proline utilization regulon transcriptional repressor/proline dehydrogenase/delta 1-pyrroline-5-carboxylate dehydrogenase
MDNGGPAAAPFQEFFQDVRAQGTLRARITAAYRLPEPECLATLLPQATLPPAEAQVAKARARDPPQISRYHSHATLKII